MNTDPIGNITITKAQAKAFLVNYHNLNGARKYSGAQGKPYDAMRCKGGRCFFC